jgi:hypothetical protein
LTSADDHKTLLEKKIEDDSTISIVWRLHGGADNVTISVKCIDNTVVLITISKERSIRTL